MDSDKPKGAAPPYVAFKTLLNFLDRYKQVVPGRIDHKTIGNSMSGGARSQMLAALRSLHLITEAGVPEDLMKRFCGSEGSEKQQILKKIITDSYPYIFGAGFDFSTCTTSLLREQFEANTSATGETVTRCMAFLKDAAQEAGLTVSPFLGDQKHRGPATRKKAARRIAQPAAPAVHSQPPVGEANPRHTVQIPAQESLLLWGLFQRLPKPGSVWPKLERDHWTTTLNNVLAMEYKELS